MSALFFSYSHKDEELRNNLETHLAMLVREGAIETWHDRAIPVGDEIDKSVDENLERAEVILLLVSADFLASPYCYEKEMQRAMQRHEEGSARVIPVILRPCDWKTAPFGKLLAAPTDAKPITTWTDRDTAFLDVVRHIRAALRRKRDATVEPVRATPSRGTVTSAAPPTAGPSTNSDVVDALPKLSDEPDRAESKAADKVESTPRWIVVILISLLAAGGGVSAWVGIFKDSRPKPSFEVLEVARNNAPPPELEHLKKNGLKPFATRYGTETAAITARATKRKRAIWLEATHTCTQIGPGSVVGLAIRSKENSLVEDQVVGPNNSKCSVWAKVVIPSSESADFYAKSWNAKATTDYLSFTAYDIETAKSGQAP
jgi:hypothetical protein